jgi:hypothetical protein
MEKQKEKQDQEISTKLGAIVLVIIAITVFVFTFKIIQKREVAETPQNVIAQPKSTEGNPTNKEFDVSDNWTLVSHDNFWNNPKFFAHPNYKFPNIKFSYPDNWKFACCNDMDFGSAHTIYSKDNDTSLPYIKITNYELSGCPNEEETCPIDKTIKITADQKYKILTSSISSSNILSKLKLESLNTYAFAYNETEISDKNSRSYVINLGSAVIKVAFVNYELLDNNFIEDFLNRISFEK